MSLDERLRSDLRTMASPAEDTQHALEAFREKAYPRRARRRVAQMVVGSLAAAAIIGGATTAVVNSAQKGSHFIAPEPSNVPVCRADDIQGVMSTGGPIVSGRSRAYYVAWSIYSTGASCRVDETIAPTFTANSIEYPALHNGSAAPLLHVEGNQLPGRVIGVVPAGSRKPLSQLSALSVLWEWKNWCGSDRSFTVSFHHVSGSDVFNVDGDAATFPVVPTCDDRSQPSVVTVTPASIEPLPQVEAGNQFDLNPRLITPTAGLADLMPVYVDQVLVEPDGKTLLVSVTHGDRCSIFARIDVKETSSSVRLTVFDGDRPGGPSCGEGGGYAGDAVRIVLKQPLGKRTLVDGADTTVPIPVARLSR